MKKPLKNAVPTMLSFLGAFGVITTAALAVKATPKALHLIELEKEKIKDELDTNEPIDLTLTKKDIIRVTWKCYIPSVFVGLSTIACIFGSNIINKQKQAALAGAYTLLRENYTQYKNAANKVFGDDADSKIKEQIAKDVFIHHDGYSLYLPDKDLSEKILCYDMFSERYFKTTMTAVLNAQYHINRNLALQGHVTLNNFYEFLGIDKVEGGDEAGWTFDDLGEYLWLDFNNQYVELEDGMECYIISAVFEPVILFEESTQTINKILATCKKLNKKSRE